MDTEFISKLNTDNIRKEIQEVCKKFEENKQNLRNLSEKKIQSRQNVDKSSGMLRKLRERKRKLENKLFERKLKEARAHTEINRLGLRSEKNKKDYERQLELKNNEANILDDLAVQFQIDCLTISNKLKKNDVSALTFTKKNSLHHCFGGKLPSSYELFLLENSVRDLERNVAIEAERMELKLDAIRDYED